MLASRQREETIMTTTQRTSQDVLNAAEGAAESEDLPTDDESSPGPDGGARKLREELLGDELIERLVKQAGAEGVSLTGQGGFLPELIRSVLERGLAVELSDRTSARRHSGSQVRAPSSVSLRRFPPAGRSLPATRCGRNDA